MPSILKTLILVLGICGGLGTAFSFSATTSFTTKFYCDDSSSDYSCTSPLSTFRVSLPLRNREFGDRLLQAISSLDSAHYGKWLNRANASLLFAPFIPPNDLIDWMEDGVSRGILCGCETFECWSLSCLSLDDNQRDAYLSFLPDAYHVYGFDSPQANLTRAKFNAKQSNSQPYYVVPTDPRGIFTRSTTLFTSPIGVGPTEFQDSGSFLVSDLKDFANATGLPRACPQLSITQLATSPTTRPTLKRHWTWTMWLVLHRRFKCGIGHRLLGSWNRWKTCWVTRLCRRS